MRRRSLFVTGWFVLTVPWVAALLLGGCSTTGVKIDSNKAELRSKAYANALAPYAAMAELAYAPAPDDDAEEKAARAALENFLATNSWEMLTEYTNSQSATDVGLAYTVWINRKFSPRVVAIAVRGTEFKQWEDWKSNLWWLTRHFTDRNQYHVAPLKAELGRVFADFTNHQDTVFITVGHSLGGGVAQCLMYAYPEVSQCYAFNPSPVTAYSDRAESLQEVYCKKLPLPGFPSHRTLRVYEKGEVLAYLRAQLRFFYPLDDKIMEVRWNFDAKHNVVKNHGMMSMARNILEIHQDREIAEPEKEYRPWWRREPMEPQPDLEKVK